VKLIILDRDGVINEDSDAYIKSPAEWHALPGSLEAIARLTHSGWRVAVATNQSGVGRGLFDLATLGSIHARMHQRVSAAGGHIDAVFFCPHAADSRCDCRKPRPGMILEILRRFEVAASEVLVVGDSLRDLQAAEAAGCRPALVLTGKGAGTMKNGGLPSSTIVRVDLAAVVSELLA
jgi:D-glycero-D-manno-heptose 1,7-bisphosphate phosphatase